MDVTLLRSRWLFLSILLFSVGARAQDPRFIYIQTENKQPFYVKLDKKYLSSSATGYIIIAKLTTGSYQINIGFPNSELPELQAALQVKEVNAGYLLKRTGDRDWALVNLQTQEIVAIQKKIINKEPVITVAGDDFSRILAEVVNDPSINQVLVVKKEPVPATVSTNEKNDRPVVQKEAIAEVKKTVVPVKSEAVKPDPVTRTSGVNRLSQDSTSGGMLISYVDKADSGNDTIKVFIPASKAKQTDPAEKTQTVKSETGSADKELQKPKNKRDSTTLSKDDVVVTEKKDLTAQDKKQEIKKAGTDTAKAVTNTACKHVATQNDLVKLRRQMAAEDNEKSMTRTAGKQFALTCFTSEQIRSLGAVFVTEDERYKFYVTAFPYVADRQNFAALEDQLSDIYYKTRFKAMLSR